MYLKFFQILRAVAATLHFVEKVTNACRTKVDSKCIKVFDKIR